MFRVGLAGDNIRLAAETLRRAVALFRLWVFAVNLCEREPGAGARLRNRTIAVASARKQGSPPIQ